MSVRPSVNPAPSPEPADIRFRRERVERMAARAQDRLRLDFARAFGIADEVVRCRRLAELCEQERRWWRLLIRYIQPRSPYVLAVVMALEMTRRHAALYQDQADRVAFGAALDDLVRAIVGLPGPPENTDD